jgi:hypothetical protein
MVTERAGGCCVRLTLGERGTTFGFCHRRGYEGASGYESRSRTRDVHVFQVFLETRSGCMSLDLLFSVPGSGPVLDRVGRWLDRRLGLHQDTAMPANHTADPLAPITQAPLSLDAQNSSHNDPSTRSPPTSRLGFSRNRSPTPKRTGLRSAERRHRSSIWRYLMRSLRHPHRPGNAFPNEIPLRDLLEGSLSRLNSVGRELA